MDNKIDFEVNTMKNADKSAFPETASEYDAYGKIESSFTGGGLTKREYFAAMAMQGLLSNPDYTRGLHASFEKDSNYDMNAMCISESIDMADELLKQLEKCPTLK